MTSTLTPGRASRFCPGRGVLPGLPRCDGSGVCTEDGVDAASRLHRTATQPWPLRKPPSEPNATVRRQFSSFASFKNFLAKKKMCFRKRVRETERVSERDRRQPSMGHGRTTTPSGPPRQDFGRSCALALAFAGCQARTPGTATVWSGSLHHHTAALCCSRPRRLLHSLHPTVCSLPDRPPIRLRVNSCSSVIYLHSSVSSLASESLFRLAPVLCSRLHSIL